MRLRFVTCNDAVSDLIRYHEGEVASWVGFTPSHVEIVVREGYLGAHYDGGVAVRPVGYDARTLKNELFVAVNLPNEDAAEKWARHKVGATYDWRAILDYMIPADFHQPHSVICSAFCTGAIENGGGFPFPIALPWHLVSPPLLLFWLSGKTKIR